MSVSESVLPFFVTVEYEGDRVRKTVLYVSSSTHLVGHPAGCILCIGPTPTQGGTLAGSFVNREARV